MREGLRAWKAASRLDAAMEAVCTGVWLAHLNLSWEVPMLACRSSAQQTGAWWPRYDIWNPHAKTIGAHQAFAGSGTWRHDALYSMA
jgi:hypothetical protein